MKNECFEEVYLVDYVLFCVGKEYFAEDRDGAEDRDYDLWDRRQAE